MTVRQAKFGSLLVVPFLVALLLARAALPLPLGFFKPASGISAAAQSALDDWIARVQGQGSDVTIAGTRTAVGIYIDGLMTDGVWNKLLRHSIYAGDTLAALNAPLKNTIGNTTDTLIAFAATNYSQSTGLRGDGSTKYLTNGVSLTNAVFSTTNIHMSAYKRLTDLGSGYVMGAQSGGGASRTVLFVTFGGLTSGWDCNNLTAGQGRITVTDLAGVGHYIGSRITATDTALYRDGTAVVTGATSGGGLATQTLYVHCLNEDGTASGFTAAPLEEYSVGVGLTSTEAAAFSARYATLRIALGRDNAELNDWITRVQTQGSDVTIAGTQTAVGAFINGLKTDSLWVKFVRMNIYAGDGLAAVGAPLKNSAGAVTDTLNAFDSGDYSQSTGLTGDGSAEYISTGLIPSSTDGLGDDDESVSVYIRTGSNAATSTLGAAQGATIFGLQVSFLGTTYFDCNNITTGRITAVDATGTGHYVASRTSSSSQVLYKAGSSIASGSGAGGARTTRELFFHAFNSSGTPSGYTVQQLELYAVGLGLSSTDVTNFTTRYATLRTALGR